LPLEIASLKGNLQKDKSIIMPSTKPESINKAKEELKSKETITETEQWQLRREIREGKNTIQKDTKTLTPTQHTH